MSGAWITGLGVVSPLGTGLEPLSAALGGAATAPPPGPRRLPAGVLAGLRPSLDVRRMSPGSQAAVAAALLALEDAGALAPGALPESFDPASGIVTIDSHGCPVDTELFVDSLNRMGPTGASPMAFSGSAHNTALAHTALTLKWRGPSEALLGLGEEVWEGFRLALDLLDSALHKGNPPLKRCLVIGVMEWSSTVEVAYERLRRVRRRKGLPVAAHPGGEGAAAILLEGASPPSPGATRLETAGPEAAGLPPMIPDSEWAALRAAAGEAFAASVAMGVALAATRPAARPERRLLSAPGLPAGQPALIVSSLVSSLKSLVPGDA